MARFANLLISGNFASGATSYEDYYPGQEHTTRIVLPIVITSRLIIPAIVDTGAPWCILDPEVAEVLETAIQATYTPSEKLMIRGELYEGRLLRMSLSLQAETGDGVEVEATVFVPTLAPGDTWPHPNFIGLDGFLTRIRFAIDPTENIFYFGLL